jgi:hypothetical protein
MEADTHWLIGAGLVTSSIIAIAANAFLLLIFCRRRGLRTVPNRFVINLLITNLLSSVLLIPLLIVDQSAPSPEPLQSNETVEISHLFFREELIDNSTDLEIIETNESLLSLTYVNSTASPSRDDRTLCYAAQASTSFVCTASILGILLIGVNQYFGVIHSLRYHFYINKCRSMFLILSAWLVAAVFGVLSSATDSDSSLWGMCRGRPPNSRTVQVLNTVYAVTYCAAVILVPFVAVCVIYVCIYAAAHKNSERMRKSTSTNLDGYKEEAVATLPKVRSAPNFMRLDDAVVAKKVTRTSSERATNNFIISLKHKISNASVFRYREETRAARISVLVIFLVLFCYVPYGVTLVLNSGAVAVETSPTVNLNVLVLLALSNVISPFLFGYRNKRVKREIGKVFGLVPPKNPDVAVLNRRRSAADDQPATREPFLGRNYAVPEVIVTCKVENERKSILKRVCQSSNWTSYKKCNFITVPESCISGEARGSFSSASTQISNEDC